MLHIVKQEYKEELVDAKPVSYFPKTDATGDVVGFGKLNATYIRVLFNYDKCLYPQTSWKLTMNASTGKMNLTPPRSMCQLLWQAPLPSSMLTTMVQQRSLQDRRHQKKWHRNSSDKDFQMISAYVSFKLFKMVWQLSKRKWLK